MVNIEENNNVNEANLKDEIISNIHEGILEVQHGSDGANAVGRSDQVEPGEHPAVEPEELPAKPPEVEPENIPKENPGIEPETETGDDDDIGDPPATQPGIVM